jgi:hypothetical protein
MPIMPIMPIMPTYDALDRTFATLADGRWASVEKLGLNLSSHRHP